MIAVWTDEAEQDRWQAMDYYIDKDCPEAALELDEQISCVICRLEQFPYSGRIGRIRGTREARVGSYILTYRVMPDCLLITHFTHGAMLFPPIRNS